MENRGGEIHMETDEARGGSTPHIVRWVLVVGLGLAIGFLSLTWITGAIGANNTQESVVASDQIAAQESASTELQTGNATVQTSEPSGE